MKSKLLLIFLILVLVLPACTSAAQPPVPTVAVTQPANGEGAYPGNEAYPSAEAYPAEAYPGGESAYPGGESAYPAASGGVESIAPPTPDASMGQVSGRLLEAGQPVTGFVVSLAAVKADETGKDLVAKSSEGDPTVPLGADGSFTFINVPAGRYALILDFAVNAFLLGDPEQQIPLLFNVEPGKTVDLGVLDYPDLPLPPQ